MTCAGKGCSWKFVKQICRATEFKSHASPVVWAQARLTMMDEDGSYLRVYWRFWCFSTSLEQSCILQINQLLWNLLSDSSLSLLISLMWNLPILYETIGNYNTVQVFFVVFGYTEEAQCIPLVLIIYLQSEIYKYIYIYSNRPGYFCLRSKKKKKRI